MNRSVKVLGGLAFVAAIVGGALWLLNDGPGPSSDELSPPSTSLSARTPAPPRTDPGSDLRGTIVARPFSGEDEPGGNGILVGEDSGIEVSGKVENPEGLPLAGARVRIIQDTGRVPGRPHEGRVLAETQTPPDGRFRFRPLTPGDRYVLRVTHPEYTLARRFPIDPADPESLEQVIRLEAGLSIEGRVQGPGGHPIAGARVEVFDLSISSSRRDASPERAVVSDASGRYRTPHLVEGIKRVVVHCDGYGSDGRNALSLEKRIDLDFQLEPGQTLSGIVKDLRSGDPVSGAQVVARPVSRVGAGVIPQALPGPDRDGLVEDMEPPSTVEPIGEKAFLVMTATTDARGRFELRGLMDASYSLQATAPGYMPGHGLQGIPGREAAIALAPSPRATGRVVDAVTRAPVTAFRLLATPNGEVQYVQNHLVQSFKSADGAFTFVDLRPATHVLVVEAKGYARGRSEPIVVLPEQEVRDIVIALVRGTTVKGSVIGTDGNPVANAEVQLMDAGVPDLPPNPFGAVVGIDGASKRGPRTRTDAGGRYILPNLEAGTYRVQVDHGDFARGVGLPITCERSGDLMVDPIVLSPGAILSGVVRRSDGTPDPKATLVLTDVRAERYHRRASTRADGTFEVRGIPAGSYRVVVTQRDGVYDIAALMATRTGEGTHIVALSDGETRVVDL
jgi:protocatechuate 3,4-dioxygenase beta subunit